MIFSNLSIHSISLPLKLVFFLLLLSFTPVTSNAINSDNEMTNTDDVVDASAEGLNNVSLEERFGIEVVALRDTAAGHMLDFRFRVTDLEKALLFFREDIKPYLVDQATGKSLTVPVPAKLGPMRPTGRNPKEGVTYWMFFGNPGLIKPGDKVTIVVGDYKLEDMLVEGQ